MANNNRTTTQAKDAQVILGIQKRLQNVPSLPLAGAAYAPADLVKLLQSRIESAGTVTTKTADRHAAVVAERALNTKLAPILRGLRQYVLNAFGETSSVLADFGFSAPKKVTKTPEQKVAAAQKAKATRKARNTMGSQQKKAVKGDVTGIMVTAITAPAPVVPAEPSSPPTGATSPDPKASPAPSGGPTPAATPPHVG